jgi:hypothetical protein
MTAPAFPPEPDPRLTQLEHAIRVMLGNGVIDLPKLLSIIRGES